jgi:protein involved in polysaccharide export with SLBB domain
MASAVLRRRSAWFLLLPLWASCAGAPPFDAKAVAMEWQSYMQRDYSLRPGDKLIVRVLPWAPSVPGATATADESTQQVIISPTGTVDLNRLPGPLQLAGKTVGAARTAITEAYAANNVKDPHVSVTLAEASVQTVYVAGEVGTAGAIPYRPGMTVTQAIAAAGSFRITVKESDIRVLRINPDGTQRTFRVNVSDVLYSEYPDFLLLPGDVVYAQTSTIADMGNWVELYIRRLLPFAITGVSVGGKQ